MSTLTIPVPKIHERHASHYIDGIKTARHNPMEYPDWYLLPYDKMTAVQRAWADGFSSVISGVN